VVLCTADVACINPAGYDDSSVLATQFASSVRADSIHDLHG
jgi:hypothetical protein